MSGLEKRLRRFGAGTAPPDLSALAERVGQRRSRRRAAVVSSAVVAAVVIAVTATAVIGADPDVQPVVTEVSTTTGGDGDPAEERLASMMRSRFESSEGTLAGTADLADVMELSDATVVGRIVDVGRGVGWRLPSDPGDEGGPHDGQTQVPFESPDADWSTVHLLVEVDEHLRGDGAAPEQLRVGFVVYPHDDTEAVMDGFSELGTVVLFLYDDSPVFAGEGDLMAVLADGHLLATVGDAGALDLPFVVPSLAEQLLAATPTLDALRAEARPDASDS